MGLIQYSLVFQHTNSQKEIIHRDLKKNEHHEHTRTRTEKSEHEHHRTENEYR